MFCVSQEAPSLDASTQLNLAKSLKEERAAKAKGKAKAKSKAKSKKAVDDDPEEEAEDTKSDEEVVKESRKEKAKCKAAGRKSSSVEGDKEVNAESKGPVDQSSEKDDDDDDDADPGARKAKSARSSSSSGQGSSKRNRAPDYVRWDVNKFDRTVVVPYWSNGKTCGLKDKATQKQVISCSIFETIRENIYFVEDLAKKVDEGASIDEVVQVFESKRTAVRGRPLLEN